MRLDQFNNSDFQRGRPAWLEAAWLFLQALLVYTWLPGSRHRVLLLRLFGARIGRGVVLKPGLRVKFPWRLSIGEHSWIGEDVWIDNLGEVSIGRHCCISQGVYLCTGSHDWKKTTFDLMVKPITIEDGVWIAAKSAVGPGVRIGTGAVLGLASVATKDMDKNTIWQGNPAKLLRERSIS